VNMAEAKEQTAAAAAAAAAQPTQSWGAAPQHGKPAVSASQYPQLGQEKKHEPPAAKKKGAAGAPASNANSNPYAALKKK
jgi:hypothetical protein